MSGSERKRGNAFEEDRGANSPKKARNSTGGPPSTSAATPSAPPAGAAKAALDIAAKRAEIQAKLAAMRAKMGAPPAPVTNSTPARTGLPPVPGLPLPNLDPDLAKKVADAKRMVESMQAKHRILSGQAANPYLSGSSAKKEVALDPAVAARGGLGMAAHPLLMDNSTPAAPTKRDRYSTAPKFSTAAANARNAPQKSNVPARTGDVKPDTLIDSEFYDTRLSYGTAGTAPKDRMGRGHARPTMKFNQQGKFVRMGEAIRAEAKMEDLKKRILESARKAGLENEMEVQGRVIKRPAPPDIEWWDAPFLPEKTYDSYSPEFLDESGLITFYIQHPIQIPAPSDKIKVEPKALFLTKKELKKMRRQRRMADLKDRQDRVKMGLLAPDPPKIKLSNMMRVLTQDAISDPTKIEAQVRREMAVRSNGHLKMNSERKLTDEERRKKTEDAKLKDEKKGIGALCFKIRYLSDPAHKSKVRNNANQDGLTGVIVYHPKLCLVIVEGGAKGLKHFKQLMLNRIRWTEAARPRAGDEVPDEDAAPAAPLETINEMGAMGELEEPISLADNSCSMIWEGTHRERMFRGLRQYNAPTNADAKEALGSRFEGMFDLALRADDAEE